uniref:Uncharacterized protein n=1 Tax=Meloidogyne enterolobii TaxID=390850 RepID=A0A6V7X9Z3_MELEN|nr:unnamed protein product [Meloidogyne enterolobii]
MDVNLHSNELEARFRLRLFTFLRSQEDLKQLISNDPTNSTQSSTIKYSQLRLELGRFLAAYYLNFSFPLLFKNIKKLDISLKDISNSDNICILPNLIIWSELEEQWIDENKEENNLNLNNNHWQLGQILSEDCSPKLAIYLLLREERILEAIFFVDHFNDSRAILLLRFLAEKIYRLQLLSDFCQNLLIKQFLERILFLENFDNAQTLTNNQEIIKYIQQNIEVALNIDVLFPSNLHNYIGFFDCLIAECAYHMGAEFEKLLEDFSFGNELICSSDNIKCLSHFLPRPPIYSIPLEEDNFNLFSKNSQEKNQESLSWLRLHRCYIIISMAFGISNRLENLIGFFALWMAQSQENSNNNNKINQFTNNSSNDLSIILEKQLFIGHSENEIYTDLNIFQTLFSVVIGMQMRDLLINSIKNNDFELINKYKIKLEVLSFPFKNASQEPKENELIWKSIKRWIKLAETEDLDAAALFLHTLQQQNQKYFKLNFPPLNELNRPNWYSLILSGAEEKFNLNELTELNKNNLQVFPSENYKFQLNNFEDILIMQYLSSEFPIVNLPPPIIQMRLELVPDEFCSCNRQSFISKNLNKNTQNNIIENFEEIGRKFSFKINENNLIKEKEEENICKREEIDELEILAEEIRSGIKRLELLEEETNLINGKEMGNLQLGVSTK